MNTWFEPNHMDPVSNMKSLLTADETTTPSGHEAIPHYANQTPSRIRLVPSQSPQQEISAVSSVRGTGLDLDDTVPKMKIVHKPEASLTPGSVSSMPHASTNLVPPRIRLVPRQDRRQASPLLKDVLQPLRNQ